MTTHAISEILDKHVTLDVEGIDSLYLNVYQPMLQMRGGIVTFFRKQYNAKISSTVLMAPMIKGFVGRIESFAKENQLNIIRFKKGERKDEVTKERLKDSLDELIRF